nr:unnamed protein product [Callosobruchus analis]
MLQFHYRFFCGFAGASFCVSAPLYTSEIAERDIRGRLGAFFQLFYTLGMLYAVFFGWAFPIILFNYACAIVPLVFAFLFLLQPESPVSASTYKVHSLSIALADSITVNVLVSFRRSYDKKMVSLCSTIG